MPLASSMYSLKNLGLALCRPSGISPRVRRAGLGRGFGIRRVTVGLEIRLYVPENAKSVARISVQNVASLIWGEMSPAEAALRKERVCETARRRRSPTPALSPDACILSRRLPDHGKGCQFRKSVQNSSLLELWQARCLLQRYCMRGI